MSFLVALFTSASERRILLSLPEDIPLLSIVPRVRSPDSLRELRPHFFVLATSSQNDHFVVSLLPSIMQDSQGSESDDTLGITFQVSSQRLFSSQGQDRRALVN